MPSRMPGTPQSRVDPALDGGERRRRARDIYLAWLLHLPADIDPSLAATALLAKVEGPAGTGAGEAAHLRALLEETVSWPREVLAAMPPARGPCGRVPDA